MTEQLQLRRGTATQVAAFTGAQGELVIDTTNNRAVVSDGATAGGWPAAKLADNAVAFTGGTINGVAIGGATPAAGAFTTLSTTGAATLGTALAVAYGGTGATTAAGARSGLGAAASGANGDIISLSALSTPLSIAQGGTGASSMRTPVSDAAYTALATDRTIAYTALTAARSVTLCAASAYPPGACLAIVDETGACSASKTITVNRAGSDLIDGATSFVINAAYGGLEIESNGSNAWTILSPRPNVAASLVGIGTAPDASNVLSAYGVSALFNSAGNFNITINKGGAGGIPADTASLIFQDGFSGRAQMGLNGSDNFSFKVSSNGSSWTTAIALDATTGVATFANLRTPISDAPYSALITDRLIAYTALTAARVVTLPAASAYPAGTALTVVDESGSCSATSAITVSRAGSDTINGGSSYVLSAPYAFVALESNGSNAWTVIDQSTPPISAFSGIAIILFVVRGLQLNTTGDTAVSIQLPSGFSRYSMNAVRVANASVSLASGGAKVGLYTAASQGGTTLAAQQALTGISSASANASGNMLTLTLSNATTTWLNASTLYVNVGTANGSPATVDVQIAINVLS